MVLPAPMVSDKELEHIAKAGALLADDGGGGGVTGSLLGSYTPGGATPAMGGETPGGARVARTPMRQTSLQDEVRAVAALNAMTGALHGGESGREMIEAKDFSGLTPAHKSLATPNIVAGGATPAVGPGATPAHSMAGGQTPAMSLTGGQTPMLRDALALNAGDGGGVFDENVNMQKAKESLLKQQLKGALKALPAPKNEYEIDFAAAIPERQPEQEETPMEEDAQDIAKRLQREREAAAEAERRRQSAAVQRDLPRPLTVNPAYAKGADDAVCSSDPVMREASRMVHKELVLLLKHDALVHPVPNGQAPEGAVTLEPPRDDLLEQARALVKAETQAVMASAPAIDGFAEAYKAVADELVYVPKTRQLESRQSLSATQMLEVLKFEMEVACHHVAGQEKKAKKTEAKLDKLTTGYLLRSKKLKAEADKLLKAKEDQAMALSTYAYMHAYEQAATPQRLKNLSDLCETQAARESMLQKRFADLVARTKAQ